MRTAAAFLMLCTAAAHAAPEDEALFLQGAQANRQGDFNAAASLLLKADSLGNRDPELQFELGWAAMGAGQAQACVERLERYEAAAPGRGQASEFLGRCYLALRQYDKAEAMLKRAVERDPRLAPTVNLSMAALEQARGKRAAARTRLEAATDTDAPTGRALRDLAGPPDPAIQPDKPLRVSLSFSAGHNSNVIALGNTIPLPTDITRKAADFTRWTGGATYTRQLDPSTSATLGYALLSDRYDGIGSANLVDHFFYTDIFRQTSERMGVSLRMSGELTELAGSRFRNVVSFRPAVSYRFNSDSVTELAYAYADSDYKNAVPNVFDRNGESQALSLVHSFRIRGTNWSGAVGATYTSNRTDGSDFDSYGGSVSGSLRYTFDNRIVAALGAGFTRDTYRNPNSLAGAGGFEYARADRQQILSLQFTGPLTQYVRWFAQGQNTRNSSNIVFYDYKQTVVSGGVAVDF